MLRFDSWLGNAPLLLIGSVLLGLMVAALLLGAWLRKRRNARQDGEDVLSQEGYIVSGVVGLMALLLGFTFSLAVDRFDSRRAWVLESANAVGTAYLRAQLLEEPHRSRMSSVLVAYTDNVIKLGAADASDERRAAMLARDDQLLVELWSATAGGFNSVKHLDFSSSLVESVNAIVDIDAARRAARQARVPKQVFRLLGIYAIATAMVFGYVVHGRAARVAVGFMLTLMCLTIMLIIDIDRPSSGRVRESQQPLISALQSMIAQPPGTHDRWRTPPAAPK